ncbi:MAG TPA: glycine betaine ABC transporter substrate-binding protein [Candidatus Dormibacteraeota bacterium]|nr:glycine betaine ABC transporter substrate-binding protein [Candidatus Dormibacteraeota bacterium]
MRRAGAAAMLLVAISLLSLGRARPAAPTIVIASKQDTEGQILAEILAQFVEARTPYRVVRRTNLGGTLLVFAALRSGAVDAYPEYTGTIDATILHRSLDLDAIRAAMQRQYGIYVASELGFNNTYVLAMKAQTARRLRIHTISDLAAHPGLHWGVTPEFLRRSDGLPGLERAYGFGAVDAVDIEKSLAYQALARGTIQVTDAYSTDGQLLRYGFVTLKDDRHFFPEYRALYLVRDATLLAAPQLRVLLRQLKGTIDDRTMSAMNAQVDIAHFSPDGVAAQFLAHRFGIKRARAPDSTAQRVLRALGRHVELTLITVFFTVLLGVPLGLLAAQRPRAGQAIMKVVGTLQTVPSIALLALMIPLFGIGVIPAIVALVLYGLLPIVANTRAGLRQTPTEVLDAAEGIGLSRAQILGWVQFPIALPFILAGVRTSAVIAVGTATIAALIGAGGLGDFILAGLTLNDPHTLLLGAIPAALLAIVVDEVIYRIELMLRPRGLAGD